MKNNNRFVIKLMIGLMTLLLISLGMLIYLRIQVIRQNEQDTQVFREYEKHYVLIADKGNSTFWENVYNGAVEFGKNSGAIVERMGENLAVNYSKDELVDIAIAAKVDGIILEGDESDSQKIMIDKAIDAGIPVVTTLADNYGSKRQAFVGITNYDLGREYARQVIKIATKETKQVLILGDSDSEGTGKNILINGYAETMQNEGNHLELETKVLSVDNTDSFASQEKIRDIFLNSQSKPDIIVCLNEVNTISAYQAVVDYNLVGQIKIIGYYASESVLNAIEKEVVSSSIVFDAGKMGSMCVEALNEYIATGYVNDYITVDAEIVNKNNIKEYQVDDSKN